MLEGRNQRDFFDYLALNLYPEEVRTQIHVFLTTRVLLADRKLAPPLSEEELADLTNQTIAFFSPALINLIDSHQQASSQLAKRHPHSGHDGSHLELFSHPQYFSVKT